MQAIELVVQSFALLAFRPVLSEGLDLKCQVAAEAFKLVVLNESMLPCRNLQDSVKD